MKILYCAVQNFASYKHLEFEFDGQGLALISGPTGSGKSTLCDVIPWVLFGRTAKGGSVDEVLTWGSLEPTEGQITIKLSNNKHIQVSRVRTQKSQDLYYETDSADRKRGKDIPDTQNLINNLLGMDFNLYLSGAYFHEFSQTAQFFTTTAKVRRQITEQIVDLSLAKKLTENMSEYKREVKKEQAKLVEQVNVTTQNIEYISQNLTLETSRATKWAINLGKKLVDLKAKSKDFIETQIKVFEAELTRYYEKKLELEASLKELELDVTPQTEIDKRKADLETRRSGCQKVICSECGNIKNRDKEMLFVKEEYAIKQLEAEREQKLIAYIASMRNYERFSEQEPQKPVDKENPYIEQIEGLNKEVNPHLEGINTIKNDIDFKTIELKYIKEELQDFTQEYDDLELLLQVTDDFRKILVKNTIVSLETSTNKILINHFDAEIRIAFSADDADKLDVSIWKDGNICSFTQLSKGQRQLLKLSFGISVMRAVANHHGIRFNSIFLDEALDGLDEVLKVKAYGLLQTLEQEYDSVFVVEHSNELKSLFTKQFKVSLENGNSVIEES